MLWVTGAGNAGLVDQKAGTGDGLIQWQTGDYPGNAYVGGKACSQCHDYQAQTQPGTPMAHSLETASDCRILNEHPRLTFRNGPYTYEITQQGNQSKYTVSDGTRSISEPIEYCFGQGMAGQTYIFRHNGMFYESRVSFYRSIGNLDITILHSRGVPASLEDSLGRPMSAEAAEGCFRCHSTPAPGGSSKLLESFVPGITCERCHGPGRNHIAAIKKGDLKNLQIFNPGKLDALDQTQGFCGACHLGFDQVTALADQGGINNIRFQAYRMFKSAGHLTSDSRMSCIACHDPHTKLEQAPASYDDKCLACHLSEPKQAKTAARSAPACPVSQHECVTCHMPRVDLPEMHFKFTDHWIRIVKAGAPVPH
jgi:hypothetical protein